MYNQVGNYSTELLKINGKIMTTTTKRPVPKICTCGCKIGLKGYKYVCTRGHIYGHRSRLLADLSKGGSYV